MSKMAKVQVTNVTVLDNPTAFLNPFQFEITFECLEDLKDGKALCINNYNKSHSLGQLQATASTPTITILHHNNNEL